MKNNIKTNSLFTNKEGKEVIANIKSISVKQAAIDLSFVINKLGDERILNAAINSFGEQDGREFLEYVKYFRDDRINIM